MAHAFIAMQSEAAPATPAQGGMLSMLSGMMPKAKSAQQATPSQRQSSRRKLEENNDDCFACEGEESVADMISKQQEYSEEALKRRTARRAAGEASDTSMSEQASRSSRGSHGRQRRRKPTNGANVQAAQGNQQRARSAATVSTKASSGRAGPEMVDPAMEEMRAAGSTREAAPAKPRRKNVVDGTHDWKLDPKRFTTEA
jgi:hypothetical protein